MAWTPKAKTIAVEVSYYLVTPDGNQILVGENVDQVLVYQESTGYWKDKRKTDGSSSWAKKSKTDGSGSWTAKTKIAA